jgi:hypothetical protein
MKTTSIKISEIQAGDIIANHGVLFEITGGFAVPAKIASKQTGVELPTYVWHTKVVADNSNGFFPKSWQNDFTIQSNDLASWAKVVEA